MTNLDVLGGRRALVTGGGTGIGLACARALAAAGATVTLAGRRTGILDEASDVLRRHTGAEVRTAACDVTDEAQVESAVAAAAVGGGLDLAVLAAGGGTVGPVVALDATEWRRVVELNLTGTFLSLKHAASAMVASGGGAVVAISSIAGDRSHRWFGPYGPAKAAVEMLVQVAADELGPAGVRVNAVRPGLVPTDISAPLHDSERIRGDYLEQMPLGRVGSVNDVAAAVRFLLGPESSWITGVCLAVDGGHHLRRGPDITPEVRAMFPDAVPGG